MNYEMNCEIILKGKRKTFDQPDRTESHKIPLKLNGIYWYCYKRWRKYVVKKVRVTYVYASFSEVGVQLDSKDDVKESDFNRLFENLDDAKEFCIKCNQKEKVKVLNKSAYLDFYDYGLR